MWESSRETRVVTQTFDEFAPFQMAQHAERSLLHFGSFSEAVDEFFSKLEVQPRAGLNLP